MNIEKFIMDIKFNLMRTHYWYASVLMQMPVVYDDPDVDTFAVGQSRSGAPQISLFVSSAYVEKIAAICQHDRTKLLCHFTEILKHEVHHLIFGHLTIHFPDHELETIACELSANSYVDRTHLIPEKPDTLPGVFPEDYGFASRFGVTEYYNLLLQKRNAKATAGSVQGQNAQGQAGSGQNGQGQGGQPADPNTQGQAGSGQNGQGQGGQPADSNTQGQNVQGQAGSGQNGQGQNGKILSLDSHEKWQGMENSQMAQIIIQAMIQSANQTVRATAPDPSRVFGNMPGELQTAIQAFDEDEPPIVPWEIILKNFLASASETILDYTMRRPSKRYGTRPGTKKEDILSIAIGIDTSGSISQDMIQLFFKELYWVEKTGSRMTVFEWDTKVQREYDFRDYDRTVQGGGGTDPNDFLETVSQRNYDCALIFTDLAFAPVEKDYHLPMLWIDVSGFDYDGDFPVQGTILKVNAARDGFELVRK